MQQPTDISQKVFLHLKSILKNLSEISDVKDFLSKEKDIHQLQVLANYLQIHEQFKENRIFPDNIEDLNLEAAKMNEQISNRENFIQTNLKEELLTEEVSNTDDKNAQNIEVNKSNTEVDEEPRDQSAEIEDLNSTLEEIKVDAQLDNDILKETNEATNEDNINEQAALSSEFQSEIDHLNLNFTTEKPEIDSEFESDTLKAIDKTTIDNHKKEPAAIFSESDTESEEAFISQDEVQLLEKKHQEERKFRLANIRGVKKMDSLFGDDIPEESNAQQNDLKEKSLLKSNVSTDYMEAGKSLPVFKLDLNDRIAFTKKLFSGSQNDLNNAVTKLNDFPTLQEAKEYLSELYYEKDWEKEDEYAQRLWNLIESKF